MARSVPAPPSLISSSNQVQDITFTTPNFQILENKPILFQRYAQVTGHKFFKGGKRLRLSIACRLYLGPKSTISHSIAPNVALQSEAVFRVRSATLPLTMLNLTQTETTLRRTAVSDLYAFST